jgi:hypothetical protein
MTIRDELVDMVARWLHQRSPCRELPWEGFTELYRNSMRNSARYLLQQVAAENVPFHAAHPSGRKRLQPEWSIRTAG